MESGINWVALSVFLFFFALVTVLGFVASRWQGGGKEKTENLDEWGLGGRNFGTWIT
jgi:SSS family solute:Na+ symporter